MYSHIYLDFLSPHKTPLIKLLEYPVLLEASEIFLKYKILFFLILKSIGVFSFYWPILWNFINIIRP